MNGNDEKIKTVMKKIGFRKSGHNEIYYQHLQQFLSILFESEGQEWTIVKWKARMSLGIGERYIKEYMRGLIAWGIVSMNVDDIIHIEEAEC